MNLVNGPVNTVRLEGSVGSNKKVVYLFMDFHLSRYQQTKCMDIRAVDINTFFIEEFDKLYKSNPNKIIDFMFERGLLRPLHRAHSKGIYLQEISDLFTKAFKLDINTNKAQKSSLVPNVRFHYTDVRNFITRHSYNVLYDQINAILDRIYDSLDYNLHELEELFRYIQLTQSEFATLYVLLYKNHHKFNPKIEKSLYSANKSKMYDTPETDNYKLIQKLIYKLLVEYNHNPVKKIIGEIINTELHMMFIDFFNYIDEVLSFITEEIDLLTKFGDRDPSTILFQQSDQIYTYGIDQLKKWNNVLKFNDINNIFMDKYINIGLYLMDLYKLRRILDKDYVTNAISYAGANHSINYIRLLIKYFGFKLTNYSYLKNSNIRQAEKIIKSSKTYNELSVLFYPLVFPIQCSDMSSFPKLFM